MVDTFFEHLFLTRLSCRMLAASITPSALETLLLRPRDPNVRDPRGETPLHRMAFNGHGQQLRLLLEAKAMVDARDARTQGWTPMLGAIWLVLFMVGSFVDWSGVC